VIERALAAAAAIILPVAVRVLPFRATLALCDAWPRFRSRHARADALARRVDRWMAHGSALWRATCLTRTLVLYTMLRQHGYAPRLHIGTAGSSHCFRAHAWVSLGGAVVGEPDPSLCDYREVVVHGA
jgi:Transglutaminase-like superfamily